MENADRPVEFRLTIASTGALRVILNQEIARIERWILIHGSNSGSTVLRDIHDYLAQVRVLQDQVTTWWDAAFCDGKARAPRMNGKRGGRPSKRQTTALRSISG